MRWRLVAALLATLVCLTAASFVLHRRLIAAFTDLLQRTSQEIMILMAKGIDDQITRVDAVSFGIATDPNLQRELEVANKVSSAYLLSQLSDRIRERLFSASFGERAVKNTTLVDRTGRIFNAGPVPLVPGPDWIQTATKKAEVRDGAPVWIPLPGDTGEVLVARSVRRSAELDLSILATLMLRVDIPIALEYALGMLRRSDLDFAITDGDVVLLRDRRQMIDTLRGQLSGATGHQVLRSGQGYLVTYLTSRYTGWTYTVIAPLDRLMTETTVIAATGFGLLGCAFVVAALLGWRFVHRITRPIEQLAEAMKKVEAAGFRMNLPIVRARESGDEIGVLHREFTSMLARIDILANETQLKEIAIRETRFRALQAQINPHFLYNTLESINSMAKKRGKRTSPG